VATTMSVFDSRYEFDAPTEYNPHDLAPSVGVLDDGADQWFEEVSAISNAESSDGEAEVSEGEAEEADEAFNSFPSEMHEELKREAAALDGLDGEAYEDQFEDGAEASSYGYDTQDLEQETDASFSVVHTASPECPEEGYYEDYHDAETAYSRPLTMPRSPRFRSNQRARERAARMATTREQAEPERPKPVARAAAPPQQRWQPGRLTIPKTPKFHASRREPEEQESEVDRARRMFEEARENRRMRRAQMEQFRERAAQGMSVPTQESEDPLTIPQEFNFRTDMRAHARPVVTETAPEKDPREVDFSEFRDANGLTRPKEFNFYTSNSRCDSEEDESHEFVSESERLRDFERHGLRVSQEHVSAEQPRSLTIPHSPHFATTALSGAHRRPKSTDDEIAEHMSTQQFRANPVNRHVLESDGFVGLKKVLKRKPTNPKPFDFRTEKLVDRHHHEVPHQPTTEERVARRRQVEHEAALRALRDAPREPTVPQSPAFATKKRPHADIKERLIAERDEAEREAKRARMFRAQPIYRPKPKQVVPLPTELTVPTEFELRTDTRGQLRQAQFEAELAQTRAQEEEARNFKAQPIHLMTTSSRSFVEPKELTVPEPFPLATESRGEQHQELFQVLVDTEEQEKRSAREFRAKPFLDKLSVPRMVEPQPLTEVEEIALNTTNRAEQRLMYEQHLAQKAARAAELAHERALEEQHRAALELRAYRRALGPKARPVDPRVLYGPPVVPKARAPAKATVPASPRFATNRRFGRKQIR
jgi:Cell cycle regulated microtubule associated protein/Targeting protein for Xklp2 (TPX2) domain